MKTLSHLQKILLTASVAGALTLTACSSDEKSATEAKKTSAGEKEIVVYSSRKEHLIKPFFEKYTQETGVEVKFITDKEAPLISRLKAEGKRSPADIFMTVDAGNLWLAKKEGVLQPIQSDLLTASIPENLRDPDNQWFGLTVRARTIVYSTERVKNGELVSYEGLADQSWKGRLCLRTSKKVYNQSLVAMLIGRYGEEKAQQIVEGWVANLASDPFSNDTKVMNAIVAGQCDAGIVNTYYFGRLQKENPQLPLALFWPDQGEAGKGVHVNISGAGITKHSDNVVGALKLLEWLASEQAQQMYAGENMEYPANPKVQPTPEVAAWGEFRADDMNLSKAGELQPAAVQLMDKAGYN
ncbi:MAG: extracellular solute-binding protein [Kangiellaceae bacterium]|nr:extracellular solute-binding protein [Kangiellaceae bacterium]